MKKQYSKLSLNVKVYDGLPARIGACEARPGLANCGETKPHKGRFQRLAHARLRFCEPGGGD